MVRPPPAAAVDAQDTGSQLTLDRLLGDNSSNRANWNMVLGPMTATMACLHDLGWNLAQPGVFQDPTGKKWIPNLLNDMQPVLDLIRDNAIRIVQEHAALGWCGRGLDRGVDWTAFAQAYPPNKQGRLAR